MPICMTTLRNTMIAVLGFLPSSTYAQEPPPFIEDKLQSIREKVEQSAHTRNPGDPVEYVFEPLFVNSTTLRDGTRHWLVGAQIGLMKRWTLTEVHLLAPNGATTLSLPNVEDPDDQMYVNGLPIEIEPNRLAVVLLDHGNRRDAGKLRIIDLKGETIFTDNAESASPKSFAESMYYFDDVNGDGRKEMMVNRRIHTRVSENEGEYNYQNQKLIYELAADGNTFREVTARYGNDLVPIFRQIKSGPQVPHIFQPGLPYEMRSSAPYGEAISPKEENWRTVAYIETAEPDVFPNRQPNTQSPQRESTPQTPTPPEPNENLIGKAPPKGKPTHPAKTPQPEKPNTPLYVVLGLLVVAIVAIALRKARNR